MEYTKYTQRAENADEMGDFAYEVLVVSHSGFISLRGTEETEGLAPKKEGFVSRLSETDE